MSDEDRSTTTQCPRCNGHGRVLTADAKKCPGCGKAILSARDLCTPCSREVDWAERDAWKVMAERLAGMLHRAHWRLGANRADADAALTAYVKLKEER